MEILVYTIIYFKNGKFFMISSNAFKYRSSAERCASEFCKLRNGDGSVWTYDIDKLLVR
mgnify:CR=1 FL=1